MKLPHFKPYIDRVGRQESCVSLFHIFLALLMPQLSLDAFTMRQTVVLPLCTFLQRQRFLLRLAELQHPGLALLGVADALHFICIVHG